MGNNQNNNKNNQNEIKNKDNNKKNEVNKCIFKYNILFVGETGVGTKTSFIQRIKEGKFIDITENSKEKNEKIIYEKNGNEIILYLIDTKGEILLNNNSGKKRKK